MMSLSVVCGSYSFEMSCSTKYTNYETRRHAAFMVFMKLNNETVIF
jgi:hypothetical protein